MYLNLNMSAKLFRTFKELVDSPLAEDHSLPEEILLSLNIKFGIQDSLDLKQFSWILSLINHSYHTFEDHYSVVRYELPSLQPLVIKPISRKSGMQFAYKHCYYPSGMILENIFKILFETEAWNSIILNPNVSKVIEELKHAAKVKIDRSRDKYINRPPTNRIAAQDLFEIWSELLEQIGDKRQRLLKSEI